MADPIAATAECGQDAGTRAMCLQRLATALCGYGDLNVAVRPDGPAPCLAVRNTAVPFMSETVSITRSGDGLTFAWSWGTSSHRRADGPPRPQGGPRAAAALHRPLTVAVIPATITGGLAAGMFLPGALSDVSGKHAGDP